MNGEIARGGRSWYTGSMTPKLSSEQRAALRLDADREAIRQGIADMEAGRVVTLEVLDARIRAAIRRPQSA